MTITVTGNIRVRFLGGLSGYQNGFPLPLKKGSLTTAKFPMIKSRVPVLRKVLPSSRLL